MTISLSWLNDYLETGLSAGQIAEALTSIGLEVEKIEARDSIMGGLAGIIAGKVLTCEKHPDADRLSLTTVDVGNEVPAQIVCGASNVAAGQMVWVALPGTTLYNADGKAWTIQMSKIRGTVSEGMICAEDELGIGDSHEGIVVLPEATHVGTKASDYYKVSSDTIFEIGLTPNRSDATAILGVAEDLAAYLSYRDKKEYQVKWPAIKEIRTAKDADFNVSVRNVEACPRYSGVLISGIQIGPSPEWMQKRLQSIGVKTINNVVDITNFILHEMGQPLHAFDADKINGNAIIVETKPSGTPFLALDNVTYELYHEDLMICDGSGQPMCIGGVYGGLHSGVTDSTTRIFLEAAHFNPGWIRRTSMRHNLRTEAARRFEKGSDPNITIQAISRAAELINTLAGGVVESRVFDLYPDPHLPKTISLHFARLNSITGVSFKEEDVFRILKLLKMEILDRDQTRVVVNIPTNKADVLREIDVIEEILRIYGFADVPLPGKLQSSIAIESRLSPHRIRRTIGQFLSSRGYLEMMNMSLTQPSYYNEFNPEERHHWVTIHNTSNESLNLMRPEMIRPALETIRRNLNRKQENLRLYEFGSSYRNQEGIPSEKEHILMALCGQEGPDHWLTGEGRTVDFFSLKKEVNGLFARLGISPDHAEIVMQENGFDYAMEVKHHHHVIGRFGKVASGVTKQFDIAFPVFIADFDLRVIAEVAIKHHTVYQELNRFPAVERDLAIVIDDAVMYHEIQKVAVTAGGPWLSDVRVFDIYRHPDHIGIGKKSVALRMTVENRNGTLTDKELDQWFTGIQKAFTSTLKAEIRK